MQYRKYAVKVACYFALKIPAVLIPMPLFDFTVNSSFSDFQIYLDGGSM